MKHKTRAATITNQLQLSLDKDPITKEPVINIQVGVFTAITLSLDESRVLCGSLARLHQLHEDYHHHQVERARINAKVAKKSRGVESGH